jgi:putative ABC transport system ATP-binding protein
MGEKPLIEIKNITKRYKDGQTTVEVLKGCSLAVNKGEIIVILGPSGSGKTTLLNIIGGIDCPDEGEVIFDGKMLSWDYKSLVEYRKSNVGFVFQQYALVSDLSVYQNVEIVRKLVSSPVSTESMLESAGMLHKRKSMPWQLSGGEQQRVAIARALVKRPALLLCDEPTGALDTSMGAQIMSLISELARKENQTAIIVTHDIAVCSLADRIFRLEDGVLRVHY